MSVLGHGQVEGDHLEHFQPPKTFIEKNSKNVTEESSQADEGKPMNSGSPRLSPEDVEMHNFNNELKDSWYCPPPSDTIAPITENQAALAEIENKKGVFNGTDCNE